MTAATYFLSITDIHFDPYAKAPDKGSIVPMLAAAVAATAGPDEHGAAWIATYDTYWSGAEQTFPDSGADTNYPLLKSTFSDVTASGLTAPEFVMYSGDFLGHDIDRFGDKADVERHYRTDLAQHERFPAFVDDCVRFLKAMFQHHLPSTIVFPCLGNTDSYDGDYAVAWQGSFLHNFADIWVDMLPPTIDRAAFKASFAVDGSYTSPIPSLPKHQLVAFNNIFATHRRETHAGLPLDPTHLAAQIRWLDAAIDAAVSNIDHVWMLFHVPVGDLGHFRHGKPDPFVAPFHNLLRKHANTIEATFSGHTHMDEFRIGYGNREPLVYDHISPAISPIFGNYPAYQVFTLDAATHRLADFATRFLDRRHAGSTSMGAWTHEYDFTSTYGVSDLSPTSVDQAYHKILGHSGTARDHFVRYYKASEHLHNYPRDPSWDHRIDHLGIDLG